ncbi:MAG: hypothetical protein WA947_07340 [Phormidesmis sp.]
MRTRKSSQSADADIDQPNDLDGDDIDMMCLVYPDGSTKNVSTQQGQSTD